MKKGKRCGAKKSWIGEDKKGKSIEEKVFVLEDRKKQVKKRKKCKVKKSWIGRGREKKEKIFWLKILDKKRKKCKIKNHGWGMAKKEKNK